jgi:hypothetical protein
LIVWLSLLDQLPQQVAVAQMYTIKYADSEDGIAVRDDFGQPLAKAHCIQGPLALISLKYFITCNRIRDSAYALGKPLGC